MRYNIYKNDEFVNAIEASEEFAQKYCAKHGYTYSEIESSPVPTDDSITAEEALAILIGGESA